MTARPEIVENPMRSHRWTCMMLQNSVTDRQLSNSVLKIWSEKSIKIVIFQSFEDF